MTDQDQSRALLPCPFCGSGMTNIRENGKVWAGTKYSEPSSVSVMHYCEPIEGQPSRLLERVGRDKQSAIEAWNRRAALNHKAADVTPTTEQSSGVELPEPWGHLVDGRIFVGARLPKHVKALVAAHNLPVTVLYSERQVRALLAGVKDSLTAAPAVLQGWLPIESAPRDGALIVVMGNNHGDSELGQHHCIASWHRGCWMESSDWNATSELEYLTHWMPLPQPPKEQT